MKRRYEKPYVGSERVFSLASQACDVLEPCPGICATLIAYDACGYPWAGAEPRPYEGKWAFSKLLLQVPSPYGEKTQPRRDKKLSRPQIAMTIGL